MRRNHRRRHVTRSCLGCNTPHVRFQVPRSYSTGFLRPLSIPTLSQLRATSYVLLQHYGTHQTGVHAGKDGHNSNFNLDLTAHAQPLLNQSKSLNHTLLLPLRAHQSGSLRCVPGPAGPQAAPMTRRRRPDCSPERHDVPTRQPRTNPRRRKRLRCSSHQRPMHPARAPVISACELCFAWSLRRAHWSSPRTHC